MSEATRIKSRDSEDEDPGSTSTPTGGDGLSTVFGVLSRISSKQLLKLSFFDRIAVEEEIHGVGCMAVNESSELIEQSLQEFRTEIESASKRKRKIFDGIVSKVEEQRRRKEQRKHRFSTYPPLHPSYVPEPAAVPQTKHYAIEDNGFRLRFLRCEHFDAKKAVVRFLNYLDLMHELWGMNIVSQRLVHIEDFSRKEYKFLRKGYIQLLPFRDRSGRRVIVISSNCDTDSPDSEEHFTDDDSKTWVRVFFHMCV